jgi:hypothetical protein
MDAATGVTISKPLSITGDVTVTGNMSNTISLTTNGIYNSSSYFSNQIGTGFWSPNMTTPTTWDARIKLGHPTQDALQLYAAQYGIKLFQCPTDGGASIATFQSTDKKLVCYGNITTQTGGSVSASSFPTLSDERVKTNIVNVDLSECERLVKTIIPKGYERTDYTSGRKMGYIAQDWLKK